MLSYFHPCCHLPAVDWVKCHSDVTDSVLTVTCNASMPANRIVCTIDGKGSHQCKDFMVLA